MEKVPMTSAGYKMLQDELKERTAVERPRIVEAMLKHARMATCRKCGIPCG